MKTYIKPTVRFHLIKPRIMAGSMTMTEETTDPENGTPDNLAKPSRFNWDESSSKRGGLFTDDEDK